MQRPALRACIFLLPLIIAVPLLLGMGTSGGRDAINPVMDFPATLVDRDGLKVEVKRLSVAGEVQLEGDLGRGNLRIAFENMKSIDFTTDSHDFSRATVHLKTGESVSLRVRNSLMIYGQTTVGIFQIRARDLQSITFQS